MKLAKFFTVAVLTALFFLPPSVSFAHKGGKGFKVSKYREKPSEHNCGDCHKLIAEQFKRSSHASSYKNSYYQKARAKLSARKKNKCNRCHLPSPLFFNGNKPTLKKTSNNKNDGIVCVTCHQTKDSTMLGTFDAVASPHKSKKSKVFKSSLLCLTCHGEGRDFNLGKSWKKGEYKDTNCSECHMPSYSGKAVEHFSFISSPQREIGRHSFPASTNQEMLKNAITVDVSTANKKLNIEISNSGAGHLIPGGRYKAFIVKATTLGNGNRAKSFFVKTISFDDKNQIAPNKGINLTAKLPEAKKILVKVEYLNKLSFSTIGKIIYKETINVR